ncbi:MAG: hypothetical protein ACPGXX_07735 [Planctomycetaceae bacterium]
MRNHSDADFQLQNTSDIPIHRQQSPLPVVRIPKHIDKQRKLLRIVDPCLKPRLAQGELTPNSNHLLLQLFRACSISLSSPDLVEFSRQPALILSRFDSNFFPQHLQS